LTDGLTIEQVTGLILAIATFLGAFATVLIQISNLRRDLNGRLEQLIHHAVEAAEKRGELAGRDFVRAQVANLARPPMGTMGTVGTPVPLRAEPPAV
jgi:hypothetical protein